MLKLWIFFLTFLLPTLVLPWVLFPDDLNLLLLVSADDCLAGFAVVLLLIFEFVKIPVLTGLLCKLVVPLLAVIFEVTILLFGFEVLIEVEGFDIDVFGFIIGFLGLVDILTFGFGFDKVAGFKLLFFLILFL